MRNVLGLALIGTALAACATTPRPSGQLDQARAEVQALSQEPLAQEAAANDLQSAQARLQDADTALQNGKPPSTVDHLAYLAERHAQAGEARVQAAAAREEVARTQDQRNRILLAAQEHEAAAAKQQLAQTQQQLEDLKAKQTERGPIVTLSDVLFDTGGATLKPGADVSLDRIASYLKAHPGTKVLIEGNTDSRGSEEYNDALSMRRAQAVANSLIDRGVSPDDVRPIGRGENYPVASNDTAAGRQQNRRVDIVFSDSAGQFAQSATTSAVR